MTQVEPEMKNQAITAHREWQLRAGTPIPLLFQENIGQFEEGVRWGIERLNHQVLFYDEKVVFAAPSINQKNRTLEIHWNDKLVAQKPDCSSNSSTKGFLVSNHSQKSFHTAESISYRGIAAGVDLVFIAANGVLRFEIEAKADSDLSAVTFRVCDAQLRIDRSGQLIARTSWGQLVQQKPRFIETGRDKQKQEVAGGFCLHADQGIYGFHAKRTANGKIDLLIDPELSFSSYIGNEDEGLSTYATPVVAAREQRCDLVLPSIPMAGRRRHLTHHRFDSSNPRTLLSSSITIIDGVGNVQDIASAGRMGCYLLTSDAIGFQPPTLASTPLDSTSSRSAVLHLGPDGRLESYTFLNQNVTSIAVDPGETPVSAYVAGNISSGSPNPYGTLPFVPPTSSALLLKLSADLSAVIWAATVGGGLGLGVTRIETEWAHDDGQGRCDAREGLVAITGWTTSPDFPNTAAFNQSPSPVAVNEETEQQAFIALVDSANGQLIWSGIKPYTNGIQSFGTQVGIAADDRSITWLTHQSSDTDILDRINADGSQAHPSVPLDGGYHYHVAVQDDATGWLMGLTENNGLASADAQQHHHGGDRDSFIRSVNRAGMRQYYSYIGGSGREVSLSLDWTNDHLYGLVSTTTAGGLSTSADPPAPFRENFRAPSDLYLFIISTDESSRLEVQKTCSVVNAQVGDLFTYTISLTNTSSTPIQGIRLRDQASSEIVLLAPPPWISNGTSFELEVPLLAPGLTQSWDIDAAAFSTGCVSNSVQVIANDGTILKAVTLNDYPCIHGQAILAIRFIASSGTAVLFEVENLSDSIDALNVEVRHRALGSSGLIPFEFTGVNINVDLESILPAPSLDASVSLPAPSYVITIPMLPAGGLIRVVATHSIRKTAIYGSQLELLNESGQILDALTQEFTVGSVIDADLSIELLQPALPDLGSTANLPYQLAFGISRGSNDAGNILPALTLNVEFTVPSGSASPDDFVLFPQAPEQLTLSSGGHGTSLRQLETATVRGDLWLATFLIPDSAIPQTPGSSVITRVNLQAQIGSGPHFQRYFIRAFLEGPISTQPPVIWQLP